MGGLRGPQASSQGKPEGLAGLKHAEGLLNPRCHFHSDVDSESGHWIYRKQWINLLPTSESTKSPDCNSPRPLPDLGEP